ncbi:MAG: tetratricopeptide repeat protein [Thermogutta sp.]
MIDVHSVIPKPPNQWPWFLTVVSVGIVCLAGCAAVTTQSLNAEGVRLYQQARYQEALQRFGQALIYDSNDPSAYYNIAAVYHRLSELYHQPEDRSRAETYYQLALTKDPNHMAARRGLAVLLTAQGRSQEAIAMLQNWAASWPQSAEPRVELARLYEEMGDRASAQKTLLDALAVDPRNIRALNALGHLREMSGEKELALSHYEQSLQLNQKQPELALRISALRNELQLAQSTPTSRLSSTSRVSNINRLR